MPIALIAVAAIADVGVAVGAITSTFAIIGAVGATVAAVGAVTKDPTLETIGAVIGGVGAIGGLAAASGLLDATSLTSDASAASAATDINATAAASGASDLSNIDALNPAPDLSGAAADAAAPSTDVLDTLNAAVNPADAVTGAVTGAPTAANIVSADTAPATNFGSAAQDAAAESSIPSGVPATDSSSLINGTGAGNAIPGVPSPAGAATPAGTGLSPVNVTPQVATPDAPASPGILSQLGSVLGKGDNAGLLAMGGIQTLGSLISGATNPMTPAQIAALNSQAAANQAAANLQTQQNANIGQPIPTATRTTLPNVTGGTNAGIINAPGTTAGITGATA